jgi:hypothetical protein
VVKKSSYWGWNYPDYSRLDDKCGGINDPGHHKGYGDTVASAVLYIEKVTCISAFVVHIILTEKGDISLADSGLRSQNLVLDRHFSAGRVWIRFGTIGGSPCLSASLSMTDQGVPGLGLPIREYFTKNTTGRIQEGIFLRIIGMNAPMHSRLSD